MYIRERKGHKNVTRGMIKIEIFIFSLNDSSDPFVYDSKRSLMFRLLSGIFFLTRIDFGFLVLTIIHFKKNLYLSCERILH